MSASGSLNLSGLSVHTWLQGPLKSRCRSRPYFWLLRRTVLGQRVHPSSTVCIPAKTFPTRNNLHESFSARKKTVWLGQKLDLSEGESVTSGRRAPHTTEGQIRDLGGRPGGCERTAKSVPRNVPSVDGRRQVSTCQPSATKKFRKPEARVCKARNLFSNKPPESLVESAPPIPTSSRSGGTALS
jgi:hypothetical protein